MSDVFVFRFFIPSFYFYLFFVYVCIFLLFPLYVDYQKQTLFHREKNDYNKQRISGIIFE